MGRRRKGNWQNQRPRQQEKLEMDPIALPKSVTLKDLLDPIAGRRALVELQLSVVRHAADQGWPKVTQNAIKNLGALAELAWQVADTAIPIEEVLAEIVSDLDGVADDNPALLAQFGEQLDDILERLAKHGQSVN